MGLACEGILCRERRDAYKFLCQFLINNTIKGLPTKVLLVTDDGLFNKEMVKLSNNILRRYCFICDVVFVSSSPLLVRFPFFHPIPDFYAKIHDFYANTPCYLGFYTRYHIWCAVGEGFGLQGGGEYPVWLGGVCSLVHGVTWECSLTCQPDPQFRVQSWVLFLQGAGEPISSDHPWVGPHNIDCNASIYPLSYLKKGFFPFLFHDSTQLREHN